MTAQKYTSVMHNYILALLLRISLRSNFRDRGKSNVFLVRLMKRRNIRNTKKALLSYVLSYS